MPLIRYRTSDFQSTEGALATGTHVLTVSWAEILWAAISVGKAQLEHLTQYGVFSGFEITYRAALMFANLRETSGGTILRSSAYDGLDPSEKAAISYFIGLTLAKLFADHLLDVPWLMHLDVYRQQLNPVLAGASRPDLVGLTSNEDWVVVEAKGRTNQYESSTLQDAKIQAQQLTTIGGIPPLLRVGTQAYFNAAGRLQFAMRDPEGLTEDEHRIPDLPLTRKMLLENYYRPFHAWLREGLRVETAKINNHPCTLASLPELEISVGLSDEISGSPLVPVQGDNREQKEFLGRDGVAVRLGEIWSTSNMRLEPQERRRAH